MHPGRSFTARGFVPGPEVGRGEFPEVEGARPNNRAALRAEFACVRQLIETRGAVSVEVVEWNNWRDWSGATRPQCCSAYSIRRDAAGRLRRVRFNLFG